MPQYAGAALVPPKLTSISKLGSQSYRAKNATTQGAAAADQESLKQPFTFADIVTMEQKTMTSVKKTHKIGMADNNSQLSPIGIQSKSNLNSRPSQSFLDKVI